MNAIPVIYRLEVPTVGVSGRDIDFVSVLPFIPSPGLHILAVPGDDYRVVESVYYDATKGELEVYFEFDDKPKLKHLLGLGWKLARH